MTDPRDTLLRECARFCTATRFLFAVLPPEYRAAHLSIRAEALGNRVRALLGPEETPTTEATE